MVLLSDILYFAAIDPDLEHIVKEAYRQNPKAFEMAVSFIFDVEFQNKLRHMVGIPEIQDPEKTQKEINAIMWEVLAVYHFSMSDEAIKFLESKGVTEAQADEFKIGDNTIWLSDPKKADEFRLRLVKNYDNGLVGAVFMNLGNFTDIAKERYGSGHAISYPSFRNGEFQGVVFRNTSHVPNKAHLRNMYKFYSPYSYSYLFNEQALDSHEEINVVEGVTDALALIRAGYPNTISPSMVRLSPYHVKKLAGKRLNFLFDRDAGGLGGLRFIGKQVPQEQIKTLALTPTGFDFDEISPSLIRKYMGDLSSFDVRNFMIV